MDTKFRLINIKYAAIESGEGGAINYSALAIYDVEEIEKTDETAGEGVLEFKYSFYYLTIFL